MEPWKDWIFQSDQKHSRKSGKNITENKTLGVLYFTVIMNKPVNSPLVGLRKNQDTGAMRE